VTKPKITAAERNRRIKQIKAENVALERLNDLSAIKARVLADGNPNAPLNCPHCQVSLLGEPIPKDNRKHYAKGTTHYKREIGMECPLKYDGVWEWMCPDCEGKWPSEVAKLKEK
jgi:hypothetical protein